jgi:hypothetical protein
MSALYPNVPVAPGVPPVRRAPGIQPAAVVGLIGDAISIVNLFRGPQWGIFTQGGDPLIVGTSVVGVEFHQEANVCTHPVEDGGFRSYNKVMRPWESRVTIADDGTATMAADGPLGLLAGLVVGPYLAESKRSDFLQLLDDTLKSLDLCAVVTPEFTYESANVTRYGYHREARGSSSMIVVDIGVEEIRIAPSPQFSQSNTASPSATDPLSGGTPSPSTPTAAQTPPTPANVGPGGLLIGGA